MSEYGIIIFVVNNVNNVDGLLVYLLLARRDECIAYVMLLAITIGHSLCKKEVKTL